MHQISIRFAVADWCEELSQRAVNYPSLSTGGLVAEVSDDEAPPVPSEVASNL